MKVVKKCNHFLIILISWSLISERTTGTTTTPDPDSTTTTTGTQSTDSTTTTTGTQSTDSTTTTTGTQSTDSTTTTTGTQSTVSNPMGSRRIKLNGIFVLQSLTNRILIIEGIQFPELDAQIKTVTGEDSILTSRRVGNEFFIDAELVNDFDGSQSLNDFANDIFADLKDKEDQLKKTAQESGFIIQVSENYSVSDQTPTTPVAVFTSSTVPNPIGRRRIKLEKIFILQNRNRRILLIDGRELPELESEIKSVTGVDSALDSTQNGTEYFINVEINKFFNGTQSVEDFAQGIFEDLKEKEKQFQETAAKSGFTLQVSGNYSFSDLTSDNSNGKATSTPDNSNGKATSTSDNSNGKATSTPDNSNGKATSTNMFSSTFLITILSIFYLIY